MNITKALAITSTAALLAAFTASATVASAKEGTEPWETCYTGTSTVQVHSEGNMFGTWNLVGVNTPRGVEQSELFGPASHQCMYIWAAVGGKFSWNGYCDFVDADGDKYWGKQWSTSDDGTKNSFEYLGGTGKYAGLKGTSTGEAVIYPSMDPTDPSKFWGCGRGSGTYSIPSQ